MAFVPSFIVENLQAGLQQYDDSYIHDAVREVEFLEQCLARARRILVDLRNRRAQTARFIRENPATD